MVILPLLFQIAALPQRGVPDPGVIATNQRITPAGAETVFDGRVTGLRFGRDPGEVLVAVGADVYRMVWADNRVADHWKIGGRTGIYGLAADTVAGRFLVSSVGRVPAGAHPLAGAPANAGSIAQLTVVGADGMHPLGGFGHDMAGSPAVAPRADASGKRVAVLPLTADDELAVVDAASGAVVRTVALGVAPLGAVIADDGSVAWVTEMAGKKPKSGDRSAPQCCEARAEAIRIDPRGIAMAGTVARVNLATGDITARIIVGLHPTAILWDQRRARVYVADGNSDQVSVIDARGDSLLGTIAVTPFRMHAAGLAPTALALSPDGATLYVALGGVNAVAVYDVATTPRAAALRGMIPTAWYPSTLDVSADGRFLAIGTLLGVGSGTGSTVGMTGRYVHAVRGAVNVVPVPGRGQLAAFTVAVSQNNRLPLASGAGAAAVRPDARARAVPERPGEPSLIHHVVYIIRENRTYDQILGDLRPGDGDSAFVMYGRDVTPNAHALSKEFVTLDRFFASGGNSADGHQWLTQANETEYTLWPLYEGRSYPYDGSDPLAYSNGGFIWDAAAQRGRSVAVFGEFAPEPHDQSAGAGRNALLAQYRNGGAVALVPPYNTTSPIPSLDRALARDFPSWTLAVPDVVRAQIFGRYLTQWQGADSMPNLVLLQLPSDHTAGTGAGDCTPKACVADNDLALGQVVDALSHSRFWNDMAIFVVEDDAQNGVDHVDGHRTVALAISPFTRRGAVDSTFYNHPSLLKTIELMLDLPALSIFDLAASDLGNAFIGPGEKPDLAPYTAIEPAQSIFEVNPAPTRLHGAQRQAALASAKMRFDIPDAAPTDRLNRILWQDAKGWGNPYPRTRASLFFPMTVDVGDKDRDDKD
ncbi:MAG TPA: bifunctional YncE family protein/alkaline phosphatase family protein [Gemmatimonadales bacterium]|jgi:YVTN family beta-propeller protein